MNRLLSLILVFVAVPALAEGELKFSGFIDMYYGGHSDLPAPTVAPYQPQGYPFGVAQDAVSLALAKVGVERLGTSAEPFGFKIDLGYGEVANTVHGGTVSTAGNNTASLLQGFVTYKEAGTRLSVKAGKFYSYLGKESVEATANANYTRGILFGAVPTIHQGVGFTYDVTDTVQASLFAFNRADGGDGEDNRSKHTGVQLTGKVNDQFDAVLNYLSGAKAGTASKDSRETFTEAGFNIHIPAGLELSFFYNLFSFYGASSDKTYNAGGLGFYGSYWMDRTGLALRYELLDNTDGFDGWSYGSGTVGSDTRKVKISEVTLTVSRKVSPSGKLMLEHRMDSADKDGVYVDKAGQAARTRSTTLVAALVSF